MSNEKPVEQLGYARILLEALGESSRCFGSDEYRNSVYRLLHCCLDIPGGPQIRTIINTYVDGEWWAGILKEYDRWHSHNMFKQKNTCDSERELIINNHMYLLHDFIAQTLMAHKCIKNYYGGENE